MARIMLPHVRPGRLHRVVELVSAAHLVSHEGVASTHGNLHCLATAQMHRQRLPRVPIPPQLPARTNKQIKNTQTLVDLHPPESVAVVQCCELHNESFCCR